MARKILFEHSGDYSAFLEVLEEAQSVVPMRLLSFCLMPNHWHLVLWPHNDGDLSEYMRWLTVTQTQRWHAWHHTKGTGPLYQGRFKSFPIQEDAHLLAVCRYVERNPLRARLVARAEEWRWSSLWQRTRGDVCVTLAPWHVPPGQHWLEFVNAPQTQAELNALRQSVQRGTPFGNASWQAQTAVLLGLQSSLRNRGRPRNQNREM